MSAINVDFISPKNGSVVRIGPVYSSGGGCTTESFSVELMKGGETLPGPINVTGRLFHMGEYFSVFLNIVYFGKDSGVGFSTTTFTSSALSTTMTTTPTWPMCIPIIDSYSGTSHTCKLELVYVESNKWRFAITCPSSYDTPTDNLRIEPPPILYWHTT